MLSASLRMCKDIHRGPFLHVVGEGERMKAPPKFVRAILSGLLIQALVRLTLWLLQRMLDR